MSIMSYNGAAVIGTFVRECERERERVVVVDDADVSPIDDPDVVAPGGDDARPAGAGGDGVHGVRGVFVHVDVPERRGERAVRGVRDGIECCARVGGWREYEWGVDWRVTWVETETRGDE